MKWTKSKGNIGSETWNIKALYVKNNNWELVSRVYHDMHFAYIPLSPQHFRGILLNFITPTIAVMHFIKYLNERDICLLILDIRVPNI